MAKIPALQHPYSAWFSLYSIPVSWCRASPSWHLILTGLLGGRLLKTNQRCIVEHSFPHTLMPSELSICPRWCKMAHRNFHHLIFQNQLNNICKFQKNIPKGTPMEGGNEHGTQKWKFGSDDVPILNVGDFLVPAALPGSNGFSLESASWPHWLPDSGRSEGMNSFHWLEVRRYT